APMPGPTAGLPLGDRHKSLYVDCCTYVKREPDSGGRKSEPQQGNVGFPHVSCSWCVQSFGLRWAARRGAWRGWPRSVRGGLTSLRWRLLGSRSSCKMSRAARTLRAIDPPSSSRVARATATGELFRWPDGFFGRGFGVSSSSSTTGSSAGGGWLAAVACSRTRAGTGAVVLHCGQRIALCVCAIGTLRTVPHFGQG